MDSTTRVPDSPAAADDDPWAGLATPEAPTMPVRADAVRPTMPWDVTIEDVPREDVALGIPSPEAVSTPDGIPLDASAPDGGTPAPGREPEPVPTAVAASASHFSFPPGVADKLAVYVYLLVDARTGRPFYVGRGRGDRCFRHVEESRATGLAQPAGATEPDGAARYPVLDRIREAESDGRPVRIEVLRHGLTGSQADLVVAAVDDALALGSPTRLGRERSLAVELGASLAKRAKFKRSHQVVLLRVGPHGADTAYATARHGWRIGRRWVDADSVRSPKWAVLVAGDLVESVYRIDGWELSTTPASAPGAVERWSFAGEPDPALEARYAGRSVSAYLGAGASSQVTYIWCGPHWVNTAH